MKILKKFWPVILALGFAAVPLLSRHPVAHAPRVADGNPTPTCNPFNPRCNPGQ